MGIIRSITMADQADKLPDEAEANQPDAEAGVEADVEPGVEADAQPEEAAEDDAEPGAEDDAEPGAEDDAEPDAEDDAEPGADEAADEDAEPAADDVGELDDEVADGDGAEPEPKDVDWFQGQPTGYESGSQLNVDLDAEGSDLGLDSPDPQPDSPEPDMQESLDISHESVDGLSYTSQPASHRSNPASPRDEADDADSVQADEDPPPKSAHSGQSDKKQLASDALGSAEELADAPEAQDGLRGGLRMEQEERLALEQELTQARSDLEQLQGEMQEIKSRNADLDLKENERSTVLEAKRALEEELLELKAEHAEAQRVKAKAEQDLSFEQEVRRAAAASRDEAEKALSDEQAASSNSEAELQNMREQLSAAEEARKLAEEAGARDRRALEKREDDVMALRIELGEKEAEVRHAGKMENLRCSVEIEKLRSELEWKSRMLTSECDELENRLADSETRRRQMEQAVVEANSEMKVRRKEGEAMKRMLDEVVARTEGAHSSEDSKLRELSAVRESVQALREEANRQMAAMENMREIKSTDFEQPARRRGGSDRHHEDRFGDRGRDREERREERRDRNSRGEERSSRNDRHGDRHGRGSAAEREDRQDRHDRKQEREDAAAYEPVPPPRSGRNRDRQSQRNSPAASDRHQQRGIGAEIFEDAELDHQIRQIEDELTVKLPALAAASETPSQPLGQNKRASAAGQAARRGVGQAKAGAKVVGRVQAHRR